MKYPHSVQKEEGEDWYNDQQGDKAAPGSQTQQLLPQILGEMAFLKLLQTIAIDIRICKKAHGFNFWHRCSRNVNITGGGEKHLSNGNQA